MKGGERWGVKWIERILKKEGVLGEDWEVWEWVLGEELLKRDGEKVVVLVEWEKSGVMGCGMLGDYVWVGRGGKSEMREEKVGVV